MEEINQTNSNVTDDNSESKSIYANFSDRLIARIIDQILITLVAYLILSINMQLEKIDTPQRFSVVFLVGLLIYHIIYSPIMESLGGTFGKKIARTQTIDILNGKAPSIGQTIKRTAFIIVPMFLILILTTKISNAMLNNSYLDNQGHISRTSNSGVTFISFIVFSIYILPFLAMLWSPTKQCWHDKFSKIAVIKKQYDKDNFS